MVQHVIRLRYISPFGQTVTFDADGPYLLQDVDGLSNDDSAPVSTQAPGQVGVTVTDVEIGARVITAVVEVEGDSWEDYWKRRRTLLAALVTRPVRPGQSLLLGLLEADLAGGQTLQIRAIPNARPSISIHQFDPHGLADIEFYCPESDWRDVTDTTIELSAGETGVSFPLEFPFEILSGTTQAELDNMGDVEAPVIIRVYGELTTPRLINVTTGQSIEIDGMIASGEFVEIRTAFGDKAIEYVTSNGQRTNWLHRLNLDDSEFWWLRQGINSVRLEADSNVNGTAWVTWRNRWAGI